jgi:tetratricopeptide (TPR) repeat protein
LDLAGTFEEARAAMIKGDYLAAIAGFEAVLKVDPNFANAANLLGVARGGAKNASQLAVDSGNKAEMSADYVGAMKQYERALQLDPQSTGAPDAIRRLKARMQSEGEAAFARAKLFDAMTRAPDAIAAYEKALQLLPTDHPSATIARERLAVLKRAPQH